METLSGEENLANNTMTRPIVVSDAKRRILYLEGEPRWEYKFIRRAEAEDPTVQLVSMLRTSENKIYRQGISDPSELANGFPARPENLFSYTRSEEHTSELQSRLHLVCRLLLEKKKYTNLFVP